MRVSIASYIGVGGPIKSNNLSIKTVWIYFFEDLTILNKKIKKFRGLTEQHDLFSSV